ncbi:hypothetical protein BH10PAT1_BH10PAT1_2530 [soil metagenome]
MWINKIKKFISDQRNIFFKDISENSENEGVVDLISSLMFSVSLSFLFFSFFAFLLTSIGFFINIKISPLHLIYSIELTITFLFIFSRLIFPRRAFLYFLTSIFIFVSSFFVFINISQKTYDLSYDSQWYHMEEVIALKNGWNPFKQELTLKNHPEISSQNILNSYSKDSETIAAVIYKFFGKIETGKSINLMIIFMSFGFVLSFVLKVKKINPFLSLFCTFLLVINPITLNQYLSFYIDGSMYNLFLSFGALLGIFYLKKKNYLIYPIIFCICLLWNIKLTAILYTTIFFIAFLIYAWYSEKIIIFLKSIQIYLISSILAIFILGFNPYVTNLFWYGNPFYSGGMSSSNYIYTNMPENYFYLSSVERFVYSIFSKTEILRGEGKYSTFKLPFTYDANELSISKSDGTTGGFGPLFSGVFILSLIGLILIVRNKNHDFAWKSIFYLLFVICLSSVFFPVSSYARFITQFWIFPVIVGVYCINTKKLFSILVGVVLITTIFTNNYLITKEYLEFNIKGTEEVASELKQIKEISQTQTLFVDFDLFRSNRIRFKEAGIKFFERSISECAANRKRVLAQYIEESKTLICYQ